MRIRELLEGKIFNDLDYVTPTEDGGREINFDIVEDLVHFMNNDDDAYRRHVYPTIAKIIDLSEKKSTKPVVFRKAVEECYKDYIKKFPIRELPEEIDLDTCKKVCKQMHEEVKQHSSNGEFQ